MCSRASSTLCVCLPKPSLSLGQAFFSHKPEGLNNVLVTKLGNVRIVSNSILFLVFVDIFFVNF